MTEAPVRIRKDLLDAARVQANIEHRSVRQQAEHWMDVGMTVSMSATVHRLRIENAMREPGRLRDLSAEERLVANARLDAVIVEAGLAIEFGPLLAAEGVTTVAMAADGRLVRHHPDGTTEIIE